MKKLLGMNIMLLLLMGFALCGCKKKILNPKNPTKITLWHNYGGVMENSIDLLIDTFNASVGKKEGIIVKVDAVSSSKELQANIDMILNGDPAAPQMPNITISYPKTAIKLANKDMLVDLNNYFNSKEIDKYVPEFINEGIINDKLYVFPVAKSTEVLFLNKTLFDDFAEETNASVDSLKTVEGLLETSIAYYNWCHKPFFTADSWFNLFSVLGDQNNDPFIVDNQIQKDSTTSKNLTSLIKNAVDKGGVQIYSGYSSDLAKTGSIVCSIGSTAGILYYGDTITYSDNTTIPVEYSILPYPTYNNGSKKAIQRGNGMVVKKATEAEEYASCLFLKWFTEPEQNIDFIINTGYLPVTKEGFEKISNDGLKDIQNKNIKKLLETAILMNKEYHFYLPPVYDEFDNQSKAFESEFKNSFTA